MSDFPCSQCHRAFSSENALEQHTNAKHGPASELRRQRTQSHVEVHDSGVSILRICHLAMLVLSVVSLLGGAVLLLASDDILSLGSFSPPQYAEYYLLGAGLVFGAIGKFTHRETCPHCSAFAGYLESEEVLSTSYENERVDGGRDRRYKNNAATDHMRLNLRCDECDRTWTDSTTRGG